MAIVICFSKPFKARYDGIIQIIKGKHLILSCLLTVHTSIARSVNNTIKGILSSSSHVP